MIDCNKNSMDSCEAEIENETSSINKSKIFPQVRCAITAALGTFLCGSINGWSGNALTKLEADGEFQMGDTESSLVVSMITYGALVGSILAGKVHDYLGRRKTMVVLAPVITLGWTIIGLAKSIFLIYIGRFLCGFATGFLLSSCTIYTSETCQASIRGRFTTLTSLSLTLGVFVSYLSAGLLHWRTSALICIVPSVLFFVGIYFVPESPYWYVLKGNQAAAERSLKTLRGPNYDCSDEINHMTKKLTDVGSKINYLELLKKRTLLPLLVALFIQTLQQACGGNVIMMYTSKVFSASNSSIAKEQATIYTGLAQIVGTVISLFLIDTLGRRILLFTSVFFVGVFMSIFGGYFLFLNSSYKWDTFTPLIICIGIVTSYTLGCRSIPWLIGGEIFNTSVRSRASSVIVVYNRLLNLIAVQIFPFTVARFGYASILFVYGGLCFIGGFGTLCFVPETKGKSLEEIQEYFEGKCARKSQNKQAP